MCACILVCAVGMSIGKLNAAVIWKLITNNSFDVNSNVEGGHTPYKHLHSHHYLVICQQVVQEGGGILAVGTHSDTQ